MAAAAPAPQKVPLIRAPSGAEFNFGSILQDHFRAGYSRPLLWFDAVLVLLVFFDVVHFLSQSSVSLSGAWGFLVQNMADDSKQILLLLLVMLVIAPALIATIRIAGWFGDSFGGPLSKSPNHILVLHCIICVAAAAILMLGHAVQLLSGRTETGRYLFEPALYNALIGSHVLYRVSLGLGIWLAGETIPAVIAYAIHGEEFAHPIRRYLVRAQLADLPTEWLPIRMPGVSSSTSQRHVRIRLIEEAYTQKMRQLEQIPIGSREAEELLQNEILTCEDAIRTHLVEIGHATKVGSSDDLAIRLFAGPRRAFEAALSQASRPRKLIASPYQTASLAELLRWHCFETGDELETLTLTPANHLALWEDQEFKLLDQFRAACASSRSAIIFVVSEVFYGSGRRIPLRTLLPKLRDAAAGKPIYIVVDGTNAVGNNCLIQADAPWDAYVFSSQHWLMARESCGVLVTRKDAAYLALEPPGAISPKGRNTEPYLRSLAGIASAMECIKEKHGMEFFFSRCERLKHELKDGITSSTRIVGDGSGLDETFVLAFRPDHAWRLDPNLLQSEVIRIPLKASVINLDPLRPWLRVPVPFYLDAREIVRIAKFLKKATN